MQIFFLLMIMKRIKNNTKFFSIIKKMKKLYCIIHYILYFLKKHQLFLLFAASVYTKIEKYLKKKGQLKYQKLLGQLIIQKNFKLYNYALKKHKPRIQTEKQTIQKIIEWKK